MIDDNPKTGDYPRMLYLRNLDTDVMSEWRVMVIDEIRRAKRARMISILSFGLHGQEMLTDLQARLLGILVVAGINSLYVEYEGKLPTKKLLTFTRPVTTRDEIVLVVGESFLNDALAALHKIMQGHEDAVDAFVNRLLVDCWQYLPSGKEAS